MNRQLVFHLHGHAGSNTFLSPSAYYVESDCTKKIVRLYAGTAPDSNAQFDILDDGVSIFSNDTSERLNKTTGVITSLSSRAYATLLSGANSEDAVENFNDSVIEAESWITCKVVNTGSGKDFTVILELDIEE